MKWFLALVAVVAVLSLVWWMIPKEKPETPYADAMLDALDRGRLEQVRGNFQAAHNALTGYSIDQGEYPRAASFAELSGMVSPTYIARLQENDPWSRPYAYSSTGQGYEIRCAGKDGVLGNGDDVVMNTGAIAMPKGFRESSFH